MDVTRRLLLKPEEVAVLLAVGRSKVYGLLATGVLPSVRVGHSLRVPAQALEHWIAGQVQTAGSQENSG